MPVLNPIKAQIKRSYLKYKLNGLDYDGCYSNGPLSLAGYFSAPTGVGAGARLLLAWLRHIGIDVHAIDLTHHIIPHLALLEHTSQPDPKCGPIIFHVNPPETINALNYFGADQLNGRLRIGYWVWELEQVPKSWHSAAKYFHEFLSPSGFSTNSLRVFGKPVREVGYPFSKIEVFPETTITPKQKDVFTAIVFADSHSSFSRKNPLAAIQSFQNSFTNNENVRLLVKLSHAQEGQNAFEQMRLMARQDLRITLITDTLSIEMLRGLISSGDVMINLHRAEGYGITIIESLLLGVPVIFTDWSSPNEFKHLTGCYPVEFDFCSIHDPQKIYKNGRWAEPNLNQATDTLQAIYQNWKSERFPEVYSRKKRMISEHAQSFFGYEKFTKNHLSYFKNIKTYSG